MLFKGFHCINVKEEEISIGSNVRIEENVRLIGIGEEPKSIEIGDNVYIGEDVKIIGNNLRILDYTKLHNHCFLNLKKPLSIGYNCWIGQNTILNAEGDLIIQNNVGISPYSSFWTHHYFGDTLEGCRFCDFSLKLIIEDDAWLGPGCIVVPVHIKKRSKALPGSVIVEDMEENHIYAGNPAKDVTDKLGPQFEEVPVERKYKKMKEYLNDFLSTTNQNVENTIEIVTEYPKSLDSYISYFNVKDRTYTKMNTEIEHNFMDYLLPEKAKFIPRGQK